MVWREGKTGHRDKRVMSCSGGVRELGMCGHSPRENRETSEGNLRGTEAATTEATGKVSSHTPVVVSPEESDGNIVPGKLANNGTLVPSESMEVRTPAKRNSEQEAASRIQSRIVASIGLERVRKRFRFYAKYLR